MCTVVEINIKYEIRRWKKSNKEFPILINIKKNLLNKLLNLFLLHFTGYLNKFLLCSVIMISFT